MPLAKALRSVVFSGVVVLATPALAWSPLDLFNPATENVTQVKGKKRNSHKSAPSLSQYVEAHPAASCMMASWYGGGPKKYEPNSHTANGQPFRYNTEATVAHRSWPFGTRVLLSFNGREVPATVTDRGPAAWTGRTLDVSKFTAMQLGFISRGTACLGVRVR